jgi:threonine dehydratase
MHVPPLADVYAARPRVSRIVRPTPLMRHPLLDAESGLDILVKHENHNPTGAFKVRGGLNLIGSLPVADRRGVITATTGNHGQSIALACRRKVCRARS